MVENSFSSTQPDIPAAPSQMRRVLAELVSNRVTLTGLLVIAAMLLLALLTPWLAPHDPYSQNAFNANKGPGGGHLMGTDHFGRDVLSRVIWGTRVSLLVGIGAPLLAGVVGTLVGTFAGYFRGWFDRIVMRFADLLMSFPTLLLGVMIAAALGPGFTNVIAALSIALFPRFIRLARASTLTLCNEPYVEASIAAGRSSVQVIMRHIIPNLIGPIIVMATLWIATAIRLEASLSFLGLGTQPPSPSWGNIIRDGMNNILGTPYPTVFAGLAITISVLAFNMVGDALRDALDPETQK
jgi:peptide/nickel transport system permease protein